MIQHFGLKNFKSHIGYNDFSIDGLTIVSGTNNSGKSSFLQAIYLLTQNQTAPCTILSLDEELELGGFSDVLNKGVSNKESIAFSLEFDEEFLDGKPFNYLQIELIYKHPHSFENLTIYDLEDDPILWKVNIEYEKGDEPGTFKLELMDISREFIYKLDSKEDRGFVHLNGLVPEPIYYSSLKLEHKKICSTTLDEVRKYLSLLNKKNIHYIKAFRQNDYVNKNLSINKSIGLSGEYTAEIVQSKWNKSVDFVNEEGGKYLFSEIFDIWVKKLIGSEYKIQSKEIDRNKYKLIIEDSNSNMEFELKQVGFGVSQLLPVLTMILTSKKNDIVLIENPEVHLHPKLQADFIDLCIYALKQDRKIIIETHSEHIINRIRLKIKRDPSLLDKINIMFFEKQKGELVYTEIEVDSSGNLEFWPKDFFDQSYHDLMGLIDSE